MVVSIVVCWLVFVFRQNIKLLNCIVLSSQSVTQYSTQFSGLTFFSGGLESVGTTN